MSHPVPDVMMRIRERHPDGAATTIDGLRVDWPGRWFHVRVSQTEPILRIICEQRGDPPVDLYEELKEQCLAASIS